MRAARLGTVLGALTWGGMVVAPGKPSWFNLLAWILRISFPAAGIVHGLACAWLSQEVA